MAYFVYVEPSQRSMAEKIKIFSQTRRSAAAVLCVQQGASTKYEGKSYQEALRTPGISPL